MNRNSQSDMMSAGASPQPTNNEKPKPVVTAGKIIHNELTYRVFDWGVNSTVGVTTSYITDRTEFGKRYFQQPIKNFTAKLLAPFLKDAAKIEKGSHWGSMFASIMMGGMAIIPFMVALEKKENKKAIIRFGDELVHGKDTVENDPRFQEVLDEVDKEPKKGFWTGMAARFIVLAPMIAATITPDINKHMLRLVYNPIAKGSKALAEVMGIKPKALMKRGHLEIPDNDLSKAPQFVSDWDFIHRAIGFDFGLTAIYAVAHERVYKALANRKCKNSDDADCYQANLENSSQHAPQTLEQDKQSKKACAASKPDSTITQDFTYQSKASHALSNTAKNHEHHPQASFAANIINDRTQQSYPEITY